MWGFKNYANKKLARQIYEKILDRNIAAYYKKMPKGSDQVFLEDHIYKMLRHESVIHDSHYCLHFRDSTPWPSKRKGNCFVGSFGSCDENNATNFKSCPIECRPKEHQDWEKC